MQALVARIEREHQRLDILVNDVWGADFWAEWNVPVWEHSLGKGLRLLRLAIDTHLITSHFALPLLMKHEGRLVVEMRAGRIVSALPVLMLLFSAAMKLVKATPVLEGFARFGYPESVAVGIGVVELLCVALCVLPRTSVLGAILLTGYLGGAIATHVRIGEPFIGPLLLGLLIWGGLYLRDARLPELIPLRR